MPHQVKGWFIRLAPLGDSAGGFIKKAYNSPAELASLFECPHKRERVWQKSDLPSTNPSANLGLPPKFATYLAC